MNDTNPQLQSERLRERYEALTEDDRRRVDRQFQRHQEACKRTKIKPDPTFTLEAIGEAEMGR